MIGCCINSRCVNAEQHAAAKIQSTILAALLANALSFGLLWACREGDANMRSA
jgi:hypothetical protein